MYIHGSRCLIGWCHHGKAYSSPWVTSSAWAWALFQPQLGGLYSSPLIYSSPWGSTPAHARAMSQPIKGSHSSIMGLARCAYVQLAITIGGQDLADGWHGLGRYCSPHCMIQDACTTCVSTDCTLALCDVMRLEERHSCTVSTPCQGTPKNDASRSSRCSIPGSVRARSLIHCLHLILSSRVMHSRLSRWLARSTKAVLCLSHCTCWPRYVDLAVGLRFSRHSVMVAVRWSWLPGCPRWQQ